MMLEQSANRKNESTREQAEDEIPYGANNQECDVDCDVAGNWGIAEPVRDISGPEWKVASRKIDHHEQTLVPRIIERDGDP
jgi:hypothetical protein